MNIFATNICPIISACNLDDKRLIKMVLESAQLLSSAVFVNSKRVYDDIYKPTHLKHPCTIWVSLNRRNWDWLFLHFQALCEEYSFRFNKKHAAEKLLFSLKKYSKYLADDAEITPFPNCTKSKILNVDFTTIANIHYAYQQYLIAKWNNDLFTPQWTDRQIPNWYKS